MQPPETRYATRPDGVCIAHQVLGEGPLDLVFCCGFISHLDLQWGSPEITRFFTRLASFSSMRCGLTMTPAGICFVFFWFYAATRRRLIVKTADQRVVDSISRSVIPGVPINAAATLIALWSPYTAIALLAAMALFYVIGSSLFGRD